MEKSAEIKPVSYTHLDMLFTSGQIPVNPETGEIAGETISEQAEQVMKNIGAVLEAVSYTHLDVYKRQGRL